MLGDETTGRPKPVFCWKRMSDGRGAENRRTTTSPGLLCLMAWETDTREPRRSRIVRQRTVPGAAWKQHTTTVLATAPEPHGRGASIDPRKGSSKYTSQRFCQKKYLSVPFFRVSSLQTTPVRIILNPLAAGLAAVPEASTSTAVRARRSRGGGLRGPQYRPPSGAGLEAGGRAGRRHWLCPSRTGGGSDPPGRGMIEGFAAGQLPDGRLHRAAVSRGQGHPLP